MLERVVLYWSVGVCSLFCCSAKPNESMKLMLVGYQKMGKTTLLSRLREVHEKVTPFTTFTQRITGEEPVKPKKGRLGASGCGSR